MHPLRSVHFFPRLFRMASPGICLEGERKQQQVSSWGFVLAAFPLVRTVSDLIATVDHHHDPVLQVLRRMLLPASGPLLFIWLLWRPPGGPFRCRRPGRRALCEAVRRGPGRRTAGSW